MKDPKKWHLFELFVADLEMLLDGDEGLDIKCPDKVRDTDGALRDIDCSVRFKRGASTFFVMFECRQRKQGSDIQWVEQVRTKRDDVKADKAILVHSARLSKNAHKKAARYNIEIRRLANRAESTTDFQMQGIKPMRIAWRPIKVTLGFQSKTLSFSGDELQKEFDVAGREVVFSAPEFEGLVSLRHLLEPFLAEHQLPAPSGPEIDTLWLTLQSTTDHQYEIHFSSGKEVLAAIEVQLLVLRAELDLKLMDRGTYSLPRAEEDIFVDQYSLKPLGNVITAAGAFVDEEKLTETSTKFTYEMAFHQPLPLDDLFEEVISDLNERAIEMHANKEGPFADA